MPGPLKLFQTELRATLSLAIPMMVGQFGQMFMGITDTLILGRVGVVPIAAIGFSNTLLGTLYVGGIGVLAAVGIFAAQAHGAKLESAKVEVFRAAFWLSLFVGIIAAAIVIALVPVLSVFGEPVPVEMAARPYLAIVGLSLIPALASMSAKTYCEALGKPVIPTVILYAGVILNIALNLPLVFGWFGLPALGIVGSAIATLCARIFILIGIIGYALFLTRLQWQALSVSGVSWDKVTSLFRVGLPIGCQYVAEAGAFNFSRDHDGMDGHHPPGCASDCSDLRRHDIHVPSRYLDCGRCPGGARRRLTGLFELTPDCTRSAHGFGADRVWVCSHLFSARSPSRALVHESERCRRPRRPSDDYRGNIPTR